MSLIEILNIQAKGDERGQLIALENNKNIPFEIKRVYYLTQTQEGVARGFHAHKELMQVAVCISGRCLMKLDDGIVQEDVWLDSPAKAILIRKMVWHEMHHFSSDCVLLVLADELYDEQDYIRSYSEFKLLAKTY
ncbi:sugar 3,4-ketoisomerase [Pseudomonas sp. TAE6080]|uniref:sugar 3,4-ketoisomerase n=1 Tax=Pseudomonas sp. TAE6080 TaxID=2840374 RepID=UPI001C003488|nr:FdtA/QdtA family cupin domain-containing protein [Pseudomonas sp. TAE6080]MBT9300642.1 FdtA/QdtA family cupin domain-containing protein [Pseudomonas sp. TAE6080]